MTLCEDCFEWTPQCPRCGGSQDRKGQRYCKKCHAAWMRENRPAHSEFTDEQRKKANCRSYSHVLRDRGHLVKKACACGELEVEMHHPDYDDPRTVVWICRECHLELHRRQ